MSKNPKNEENMVAFHSLPNVRDPSKLLF